MKPWSSLITAPTAAQTFSALIGLAKLAKFPTTSWGTRSVPRVLLQLFASSIESFGAVIVGIAKSGFRTTALGDWLDAVAEGMYGISRFPATFTVVAATVHNDGVGPQTIMPGDLYLVAGGLLYRNVGGTFTVGAGASQELWWQAEHAGASYNLDGEALEGLATPLVGVSLTAAAGIGWIVTQGVDVESDEALATRCGEQWSTLGASGDAEAYAYNAKLASAEVTRVRVYEDTPAPGWVTMYLAGPAGPISVGTANAVKAWIEAAGRRPMCVGLVSEPAGTQTITCTGTVKVKAGTTLAVKARIAEAFLALQAATDFGGTVDYSEVVATVRTTDGVLHLALTAPVADVVLGASQLAVMADALTYQEV
jgi:uncharacterized phage protein gp47/JayE